MTLNDDDCYRLFLCLDSYARALKGENETVNAMRERFLPFYREWHAANPHKVHPSAYEAVARRNEQLTINAGRNAEKPR